MSIPNGIFIPKHKIGQITKYKMCNFFTFALANFHAK